MITFFVTAPFTDTIENYLATWGSGLRSDVNVVTYEQLFSGAPCDGSTFVFGDLERLSAEQLRSAEHVWGELETLPEKPVLLNRPSCVLSRTELLTRLHDAGINEYAVYSLPEGLRPRRFPVFLRHRTQHWGPLTSLIHDERRLELELARRALIGGLDELLVVEFCDTADPSGLYRKYSAFVIDDEILPRHLIFDRAWALKSPNLLDTEKIEEERVYLETNPHADELRAIARLAGIGWGRFDYGLFNGRVQIWEINTNPVVMQTPSQYAPTHIAAQEWFAARVESAIRALEGPRSTTYHWTGARANRSPPSSLRGSVGPRLRASFAGRAALAGAARVLRPILVRRLARRLEQKVVDGEVVEQSGSGRHEDSPLVRR